MVAFFLYNNIMKIISIYETSYQGMYKVKPEEGPTFFIRPQYLPSITLEQLEQPNDFNETLTEELLDAGLICVVELKAVEYLARCEQSRFGLTQKLINKKYDKKYIDSALTYLESKNYLSDERFSRAWLHSRSLNHFEGRTKLLNELMSRGISKETAIKTIDEFFTENDEVEICKKAMQRFIKKGKKDEKLVSSLLNSGFSYKIIKIVNEKD